MPLDRVAQPELPATGAGERTEETLFLLVCYTLRDRRLHTKERIVRVNPLWTFLIGLAIPLLLKLFHPWKCNGECCGFTTWNAEKMIRHIEAKHTHVR